MYYTEISTRSLTLNSNSLKVEINNKQIINTLTLYSAFIHINVQMSFTNNYRADS